MGVKNDALSLATDSQKDFLNINPLWSSIIFYTVSTVEKYQQ